MLDMPKRESAKPSQVNRSGTPLNIRVADEIMDAMKSHQESLRPSPTFTALVEDAFTEYLEKRGVKIAAVRK
jgi:hypothetical protein